ncbi:MAG TPA: cobalt ABC transporter, partial [Acidaminococcaceae bacterium]|nr:cobalt ABC transporter [Acidaminococcaceae bacterium]
MIEAKNINFAYRRGIPVLTDINCTIGNGGFVGLLG